MLHVDQYEKAFLWLAGARMAAFGVAVLISVFGFGIHLPHEAGQIDPAEIDLDPGFGSPGLREIRPGVYEAYFVLRSWTFTPNDITVPVDSRVTFFLTSGDVIHGFKVFDTDINIMVIPGQISEVTYTFDEPGDYRFYCHEYCGAPHHTMTGLIHVVESGE